MVRSTRVALSLMVTAALAAPAVASAQAVPTRRIDVLRFLVRILRLVRLLELGRMLGVAESSGSRAPQFEQSSSSVAERQYAERSGAADLQPRPDVQLAQLRLAARPTRRRASAPGGVVAGSGLASSRACVRARVAPGRVERGRQSATPAARSGRDRDGPRGVRSGGRPYASTDDVYVSFPHLRTVGLLLSVVRLGVRLGLGLRRDTTRGGTAARCWGWGRYGMWYDPWGYYPSYDPYYVRRRRRWWRRRIQRTARAQDHW